MTRSEYRCRCQGPIPSREPNRPPTRSDITRRARPRYLAPTTVWPCANSTATWLHTGIAGIVTTYTRPGHRVLLITPPRQRRGARTGLPGPDSDPYLALPHTAQTAARLGRSARTQTAHQTGTDPVDLAIATVDPHDTAWTRTVPWPDLLTPTGTIAIITHPGRRDQRLVDPVPGLVTTVRRAGLTYHDHIVLLDGQAGTAGHLDTAATHHDLLIFTRRGANHSGARHG